MPPRATYDVSLQRHDFSSSRPFADVLQIVRAGLGHPDFPALTAQLSATGEWAEYSNLVAAAAGSSGLMTFLELDLGEVVRRAPEAPALRAVRIIAGNPVTMASMVRSTPAAGAFAPVTILIVEREADTLLRYDTILSAVGAEWTPAARRVGHDLDAAVLALLESAAGPATA